MTYGCILDETKKVMGTRVSMGGQVIILQGTLTHCLEAVLSLVVPRKRALAALASAFLSL